MKRPHITPEGKQRLRELHTGKTLSDHTKRKISESQTGKLKGANSTAHNFNISKNSKGLIRNRKLQNSDVLSIRIKHVSGNKNITELAVEYGVSLACISRIVNNKSFINI